MPARFAPLACLALAALASAGCGPGRLNVSKSIDLDSGEARAIDLDAQPKPQKVSVEFSSSEGEVSVLLFKEADAKGEDGLFASDPAKALEKKRGQTGSFTADVPENTAVRLIIRGSSKKTKVDVKITNKQ